MWASPAHGAVDGEGRGRERAVELTGIEPDLKMCTAWSDYKLPA